MNHIYGGVYIPNIANAAEQYGIGQYRFAHNYELQGEKFNIRFGEKIQTLFFSSRDYAELDGEKIDWEALKLTENKYFVRLGQNCIVIDTEKNEAAMVQPGKQVLCGTLSDETPVSTYRDAGEDLTDTCVRWVLGYHRFVVHDYTSEGKIMIAWTQNLVNIGLPKKTYQQGWFPKKEDFREEEALEISLGGPFYMVVTENGVPEDCCADPLITRIVLLEDFDRMMAVGCAFRSEGDPIMITAYGVFFEYSK